ncbi:lipoprotein [Caballeronia arvi]|uniref:Lipoprotein n=2 Tax=Caballeronia arvi TaxID=1777135 RepID=A0A158EQR9_9BURK|nr:lipoprotein [Caballeronia arvi]
MNKMNKTKKSLLIASLAAALGMGLANVASAEVHHPAPHHVKVGWHGDRYWDGHRYWQRSEWERHHHATPAPHRYY